MAKTFNRSNDSVGLIRCLGYQCLGGKCNVSLGLGEETTTGERNLKLWKFM